MKYDDLEPELIQRCRKATALTGNNRKEAIMEILLDYPSIPDLQYMALLDTARETLKTYRDDAGIPTADIARYEERKAYLLDHLHWDMDKLCKMMEISPSYCRDLKRKVLKEARRAA